MDLVDKNATNLISTILFLLVNLIKTVTNKYIHSRKLRYIIKIIVYRNTWLGN